MSNENKTIKLREYNVESGRTEETGEEVNTYTVARSMTIGNFSQMFDEFLNLGGKGFPEGKTIGGNLRFTHRTLQRLAICFALGIIVGLSDQEYTDARNETAIETAKKLAQMLENGELPLGLYV